MGTSIAFWQTAQPLWYAHLSLRLPSTYALRKLQPHLVRYVYTSLPFSDEHLLLTNLKFWAYSKKVIWQFFIKLKQENRIHNPFHSSTCPHWCGCRTFHDDVIKWKHFPRYLSFVQGIHRSPVNSPHKDQWRGALMFSLICAWINDWVNNREAGDLRRHRARYDVTVMWYT